MMSVQMLPDLKKIVMSFLPDPICERALRKCLIAICAGYRQFNERGIMNMSHVIARSIQHRAVNMKLSIHTEILHTMIMNEIYWGVDFC